MRQCESQGNRQRESRQRGEWLVLPAELAHAAAGAWGRPGRHGLWAPALTRSCVHALCSLTAEADGREGLRANIPEVSLRCPRAQARPTS